MPALRVAIFSLISLLTLPWIAHAATFTVGPGGTHATLQAALVTAGETPGDHEIRIATATHVGNVQFVLSTDQRFDISGGWNAGFTLRSDDPALTVLQGTGNIFEPTLWLTSNNGELHVENLTLTHPSALENQGTCLRVHASGTHVFHLRESVVRGCEGFGTAFCIGNGIDATALQSAQIELSGNHVHDNRCEPNRSASDQRIAGQGTGIRASSEGSGRIVVRNNLIENNLARSYAEQSDGIGLHLIAYGDSSAEVSGNRILGNRVVGESVGAFTPVNQGYGLLLVAGVFGGSAEIVARGNLIADNRFESPSPSGAQAFIEAYGGGRVLLGDSAIVGGVGGHAGLQAGSQEATSTVQLVNLTVADNDGNGIRVFNSTGALSLYNSLSDRNASAVALTATVDLGSNRLDLPAGFVDAAGGDYRLASTSPALDIGDLMPPGELGSVDLDGGPRISGPGVDLGAYELESFVIFRSGFEALP